MNDRFCRLILSTLLVVASGLLGLSPVDVLRADDTTRSAASAVAGLDVADGLEATLFASEPMMLSPTNIDVDHLGRVWVVEVVNYRSLNGTRSEGDRILVLEDSDGDGRADTQHVFYQGNDINGAMGVCVLGEKVIVSAAPNIFVFTDSDGDLKPDKKELLFAKTGQEQQHDHTAHAFVFGPDGKLYWNFGNAGKHVHDKQGNIVVDRAGNEVIDNGKPYHGGMVFRCNLDGGEFEVVGHNFRNNYEVAVDSFGTLWQSDNDDDGNRGVRINYVMEYGNYGYRDEMTGAGWRTDRVGSRAEIPERHWHLNDPGVVPNLLQTGAGSPTGICIYEGRLLPEVFHDQIIHCDAGPNVVRAYPVTRSKAGYAASVVDVLKGTRDQWFRPADVCVAPDGSLIVADWYDPGVGGHRMGDSQKGRLFRIAPPNAPYHIPEHDFSTLTGAAEALASPNHAVRYLAWRALHNKQGEAEPMLRELFERSENPRLRARALWLLANIPQRGEHYVDVATKDSDPDVRIAGLRIARRLNLDLIPTLSRLTGDESPQVRRECAVALRGLNSPEAVDLWVELALEHDGADRWYLEALGIAADGKWDDCLKVWLDRVGTQRHTPAGRDIIWRSRASYTPRYLAAILVNGADAAERYLRAFDFLSGDEKQSVLNFLAFRPATLSGRNVVIAVECLRRLEPTTVQVDSAEAKTLGKILSKLGSSSDFVMLVEKFRIVARYHDLLSIAIKQPRSGIGVQAIRVLLKANADELIESALKSENGASDKGQEADQSVQSVLMALGNSADGRAARFVRGVVSDLERPAETRRIAVGALARFRDGAMELIDLASLEQLDADVAPAVAAALHAAPWKDVKKRAAELFPLPPTKDAKPLPPIAELVKRKGDPTNGRVLYNTTATCIKCHQVNGLGNDIGPNLSEIGNKLGRQELLISILFPSAGISHNYENYSVLTESGTVLSGIITSRTPDEILIKGADAILHKISTDEIEEISKQPVSLMPTDVQKLLTTAEIVDVVEYLTTLKKASR